MRPTPSRPIKPGTRRPATTPTPTSTCRISISRIPSRRPIQTACSATRPRRTASRSSSSPTCTPTPSRSRPSRGSTGPAVGTTTSTAHSYFGTPTGIRGATTGVRHRRWSSPGTIITRGSAIVGVTVITGGAGIGVGLAITAITPTDARPRIGGRAGGPTQTAAVPRVVGLRLRPMMEAAAEPRASRVRARATFRLQATGRSLVVRIQQRSPGARPMSGRRGPPSQRLGRRGRTYERRISLVAHRLIRWSALAEPTSRNRLARAMRSMPAARQ